MQTPSVPGRSLYLNLIIVLALFASITMAESTGEASSEAKVHIIYTEKPTDEEPKDYHLRTLSSALGRSVPKKKTHLFRFPWDGFWCVIGLIWFGETMFVSYGMITVRKQQRTLWSTVTRKLLLVSQLSSHLSKSPRSPVCFSFHQSLCLILRLLVLYNTCAYIVVVHLLFVVMRDTICLSFDVSKLR